MDGRNGSDGKNVYNGYMFTFWRARARGHHGGMQQGKKGKPVAVRLDARLEDQLREVAEATGNSLAEVIEACVAASLPAVGKRLARERTRALARLKAKG